MHKLNVKKARMKKKTMPQLQEKKELILKEKNATTKRKESKNEKGNI